MNKTPLPITLRLLGTLLVAACSNPQDSDDTSNHTGDIEFPEGVYTHKMMKNTGENQFAALAYECPDCTFQQHLAIDPPEGWSKGPTQVATFSSGELRSTPDLEGVPDAMDFVPEVPGEEYGLIAKTLDGTLVEMGQGGAIARVRVMRDTLFTYSAGTRVHELTDPDGNLFVLFAYGVDPKIPVIPDFNEEDVLGDFSGPTDWVYSTRILDEELLLDTPEVATVLAIRSGTPSTWEMR